jgi:hypothetical protein
MGALVKIEARNSYVSNYIGDFKTTIRPIAARFSWNPRGSYVCSSAVATGMPFRQQPVFKQSIQECRVLSEQAATAYLSVGA